MDQQNGDGGGAGQVQWGKLPGNTLYYGDNLFVLKEYVRRESVDLVYLDPPFNSNATYNVLFAEQGGARSPAQVKAFKDTWEWDIEAAHAYQETVQAGGPISQALQAFRLLLRDSAMMAYLAMMAPRLVALHRVLKPTGSLYLHCDPTASHYLKLLLDAVFGPAQFRNEIVWRRYGTHNDVGQGSRRYGRVHDVLLFYVRGAAPTWQQVFTPLDPAYVAGEYRTVEEGTGRRYSTSPLTGPGGEAKGNPVYEWNGHTRAWRYSQQTMQRLHDEGRLYYSRTGYPRQKLYLDESKGVPAQDVWDDISSLSGTHSERMGYPTQKPQALLERIIQASSNPGDVVLDPFCGCGTAIEAAQKLGRRWIGIDITHLAISLIKLRLRDRYGDAAQYTVVGEPVDLDGAAPLARENPYQFQWWALGLVGARPAQQYQKKGADQGIDGRLYFHDQGPNGKTKQIILSVKGGKTGPDHVRDLLGVLQSQGADIGVLITLQPPTQPMRAAAASAEFYHSPGWGQNYPRVQLLTVADLLTGKRIDYPPAAQTNVTYKKAPKAKVGAAQVALPTFPGA